MGPRLRQIDELNKLGIDSEAKAALLDLPLKTVREYENRIRHIDGETVHRGRPCLTVPSEPEGLNAERNRMANVLAKYNAGELAQADLPLGAHTFYGRIRRIDQGLEQGKEPTMAQERHREIEKLPEILTERRAEILRDLSDAAPLGRVEAMAATNYFRGRADEFDGTLESIAQRHPQLAKDLPPAIAVDEIVVRQQTQERERSEDKSLQMTR